MKAGITLLTVAAAAAVVAGGMAMWPAPQGLHRIAVGALPRPPSAASAADAPVSRIVPVAAVTAAATASAASSATPTTAPRYGRIEAIPTIPSGVKGRTLASCSWDRPGANPYMGDVVAAVDSYTDIPEGTRAALKRRIAARQYDELATIKRDSIEGAYRYTGLRDMHFGKGTICQTVTRDKWKETAQERGLVYCEDGHCLIVPTVCRNVSRITRLPRTGSSTEEVAGGDPGEIPVIPFGSASVEQVPAGPPPGGSAVEDPGHAVLPPGGSETDTFAGGSVPPTVVGVLPPLPPATFVSGLPPVGFPPGQGGWTPDTPGGVPIDTIATPIPEPETWALMLGGLGLVGWVTRRRRFGNGN